MAASISTIEEGEHRDGTIGELVAIAEQVHRVSQRHRVIHAREPEAAGKMGLPEEVER